jgi:hypothetical protein
MRRSGSILRIPVETGGELLGALEGRLGPVEEDSPPNFSLGLQDDVSVDSGASRAVFDDFTASGRCAQTFDEPMPPVLALGPCPGS